MGAPFNVLPPGATDLVAPLRGQTNSRTRRFADRSFRGQRNIHTRLFDKSGYQKGRSFHRAGHQRQTNRQKRDRQKKNRITDKLMNEIIIIPTETMDTVATITSKQIKSKCNTEIGPT